MTVRSESGNPWVWIGFGVAMSVFVFAVPLNSSLDPINILIAILSGTTLAIALYMASRRVSRR
jgi:xanthine/uracil permease